MAEAKVQGVVFDLQETCIGTFLNLVVPKRVSQSTNETPTYSINAEIDAGSKELTRLRAAIGEAAKELFPGLDLGTAIKSGDFIVPLVSGDLLADKAKQKSQATGKERLREWSRGKFVLTARSKEDYPPALTIVQGGKVIALEGIDAKRAAERANFYSGQRILFGVRLKAYNGVGVGGKPGVKAYLEAVHSCGGGEKLFGGRDPTERFRDYIGLDSEEDPTVATTASGEW